jgi:hypothetical protein
VDLVELVVGTCLRWGQADSNTSGLAGRGEGSITGRGETGFADSRGSCFNGWGETGVVGSSEFSFTSRSQKGLRW